MYFTEKERQILKNDKYDIIVVGSGPSGIGAALSAGRLGSKVLLIESCGDVGGISTTGMMSHWTGRCGSKIYWEILERAAEKNLFKRARLQEIDPELLKNTYYEMLKEANVDILLYTFFCASIVENNKVKGVVVENKTGRTAYMAKVVIDCTGDGDVAYRAGAEFYMGREEDGKMQPATLMFKVGGVDETRAVYPGAFEDRIPTPKGELQELGKKHLEFPTGHCLMMKSIIPGIATINMTNVLDVDGTKAEDLTKAEITCREQMGKIIDFLREYAPGYKNCYLISAASLIGIRETRHFKGLKQITEEDIVQAVQFADAVVFDEYFNFDIHNIVGSGLDEHGVQFKFTQKNGYTIPYGCMVPEKIDGLLLSGRNISGTHKAHSNFRAMPICVGIGEADGIAAFLSIKHNIELRDVDPKEIQKYL